MSLVIRIEYHPGGDRRRRFLLSNFGGRPRPRLATPKPEPTTKENTDVR